MIPTILPQGHAQLIQSRVWDPSIELLKQMSSQTLKYTIVLVRVNELNRLIHALFESASVLHPKSWCRDFLLK